MGEPDAAPDAARDERDPARPQARHHAPAAHRRRRAAVRALRPRGSPRRAARRATARVRRARAHARGARALSVVRQPVCGGERLPPPRGGVLVVWQPPGLHGQVLRRRARHARAAVGVAPRAVRAAPLCSWQRGAGRAAVRRCVHVHANAAAGARGGAALRVVRLCALARQVHLVRDRLPRGAAPKVPL
eukprot:2192650-Prymnesium_polylepis.2